MPPRYETQEDIERANAEAEKYAARYDWDWERTQGWLDNLIHHDFVMMPHGSRKVIEYTEVKCRKESYEKIKGFGGTVIYEQHKVMSGMMLTMTNPQAEAAFLAVLAGVQYVARYGWRASISVPWVEMFTRNDRPDRTNPVCHIPLDQFTMLD